MRENIIEQLRFCASRFSCEGCIGECKTSSNEPRAKDVLNDAADAIEELLAENKAIKQSNKDAAMRNKLLCDEISRMKEKVPHWISVEDALPEIGKSVLLFNGAVHIGWRVDGKRFRFLSDRYPDHPTHWMPLPRAPEEVEGDA